MTDSETDPNTDPTRGLAVLVDPLGPGDELPSLSETEARFERLADVGRGVAESRAGRRTGPRSLAVVGVVVALLTVAATMLIADGDNRPAAALSLAVEQTDAVASGSFSVSRVVTAEGRTLTQSGRISFNGSDYAIRYENAGGIIDPASGGVTPPSIEFREVDGTPYVGTDRGWVASIDSPATHPMRDLTTRLADAAATAESLERCQDPVPGRHSYCLTTDDPQLVNALQPGLLADFETVTATVRVDVDQASGRLARITVDATQVVLREPTDAPGPGPTLPAIDSLRSETSFDGLDQPTTIEVPDLAVQPATGDVPWQCDGLEHSEVIVECLEFYGEPELAEYYRSLDLEPMDPPPPGAYGPADAPYIGPTDEVDP